MKAMSDKEAAVFWKKHADFIEKKTADDDKEAFDALRALRRTLGIDPPNGSDGIADCIKKIDATIKKRLAGR